MYANLLLNAFEKAEKEPGLDSTNKRAIMLSNYIEKDCKAGFSDKSLRDKLKEASTGEPIQLKLYVADSLSRYLGYENYKDYVLKNSRSTGNRKKALAIIITLLLSIAGFLYYLNTRPPTMMIWNEDHYEVVEMDLDKYDITQLKVYREDRIINFKKVQPDCSYEFFNEQGQELLWYGKNESGELEYFTDLARHPETGKTLKRITPYMIRTHICPSY